MPYVYKDLLAMINRIRLFIERLKYNKDEKVVMSNLWYMSLLQIAGYIFPLVSVPYMSRIVGAFGFGKIAFAAAVMVWIQTVVDWGFNYTATRDVARNRNNLKEVSNIFSTVLFARLLLMTVSFILLNILLCVIPQFKESRDIILVTFLMVPGHIFFPDWFFQGMERMKYVSIMNLLTKFCFTIAIFVFIKKENDYILYPLFLSLGYLVSGSLAMYVILMRWKIRIVKPRLVDIINKINGSTDVFINNLVPNFYNNLSVLLLGFFFGPISNGIYDAGKKIVYILDQFINVVTRVFFPYIVRKPENHAMYAKLSLFMALLCSILLFIFAPFLISVFYGQNFDKSIDVLRITSFSVFFYTLIQVYGKNYMLAKGLDKELRNITVVVSIVGLFISVPFVYYFSYIGASLTFLISSCLLGGSCCFYVRYRIKTS